MPSPGSVPAGADVDRQVLGGREDGVLRRHGRPHGRVRLQPPTGSAGRSRRAWRGSASTGSTSLCIHDPDDHWEAAIGEAFPALARLREEGVIGAVGVGMNQSAMLARFAREGDFDVFLLAGRYTLLDQDALAELLPLCVERGIAVHRSAA